MSSKVMFHIVHSEGNLRFGPDGFRIDSEVHTMSVSVVVSRAMKVHENDRNIAMETEDVECPSHVGDFVEPSGEDEGNDTGVV
ncbi:hypothetical protein [Oryza sativa Japonica Group]|uniref:Uncharacterized protein n=1 Tax=Oryza sativa subsp. japonica TaxID=39947 RepID=Q5NBI7_ORYSJ|nr:hypothetical protein [Oryza sativa Japonica Group]